jgi:hypothetical protein
MGYDFVLARMHAQPAAFPARIPDNTSQAVVPVGDPAPLYEALRASALVGTDALEFQGTAVIWNTRDGGTLDINPSGLAINVDTHANWDHVAQLLDLVRGVWPEAALMDFQTGDLHDPASFRAFIERTRDEAARARGG